MSPDRSASFDDIAFLAASEPRLTVLRTLTATATSQNQQDLAAATDHSPAHVARILTELDARKWIVETDTGYRVTPLGMVVVEGFSTTLATLATEHRLRTVIQWMPTDVMEFDIGGLRNAEIVLPTESDPPVVGRRLAEWVGAAEQVRLLADSIAVSLLDAIWHATVYDEQRFETVLARSTLDVMRDDTTIAPLFLTILESGTAKVFVAEEERPVQLVVVDDDAVLMLTDDVDTLQAVIRSDETTIHDWAVETFETYRADATRVEPDAFTA